nr:hypothetical protein HK105_005595 [Polyrhizophydium stewartii]
MTIVPPVSLAAPPPTAAATAAAPESTRVWPLLAREGFAVPLCVGPSVHLGAGGLAAVWHVAVELRQRLRLAVHPVAPAVLAAQRPAGDPHGGADVATDSDAFSVSVTESEILVSVPVSEALYHRLAPFETQPPIQAVPILCVGLESPSHPLAATAAATMTANTANPAAALAALALSGTHAPALSDHADLRDLACKINLNAHQTLSQFVDRARSWMHECSRRADGPLRAIPASVDADLRRMAACVRASQRPVSRSAGAAAAAAGPAHTSRASLAGSVPPGGLAGSVASPRRPRQSAPPARSTRPAFDSRSSSSASSAYATSTADGGNHASQPPLLVARILAEIAAVVCSTGMVPAHSAATATATAAAAAASHTGRVPPAVMSIFPTVSLTPVETPCDLAHSDAPFSAIEQDVLDATALILETDHNYDLDAVDASDDDNVDHDRDHDALDSKHARAGHRLNMSSSY